MPFFVVGGWDGVALVQESSKVHDTVVAFINLMVQIVIVFTWKFRVCIIILVAYVLQLHPGIGLPFYCETLSAE